jgi:aromatic ring-cleaving dioxygenase
MKAMPEHSTLPNVASIDGYHVHVYYEAQNRRSAERLRERIAANFPAVEIGPWHDDLVGPHTFPMFRIGVPNDGFAVFMPWLMLNRDGLSVLVHPETGDPYADHARHAAWLGNIRPLKFGALRAPG